jgi:CHAT domain-containing protein/Tfp pilus assembly protein PilF
VGVVCLGGCSRPVLLVPGEAVEGELSPDGSAVYSLELGSGEYVRLVVAPQTPDGELALRVVAPDDRPLIEAAGIHDEYAGLAAWITDAAGDHRIEIDNPNPATSTAYRLVVEEVRPQREGDEHRAAAQRAGAEAARLAARDEVDQAIAALERALEDWRRAGDAALMAEILIDIVSLQWLADPDAAVARSEEALALSTAAALPWWRIEALNWQGRILRRRADCAGAQAAYDEALAIARASGELEQAAVTAFNRAVLLKDCAPDRAPAAFEELVAEAQRAGDATTEAIGLRELAAFARNEGDLAEARDLIERAWRRAEASKDRVVQADVSHERGNLDRWEGRLEEAVENYRRCLTLTETRADRRRVVDVLLSLGALALDLRRPEEAWEHYQDALAAAEALGDPARQSEALRELGIVLFRQTEYARAEEYFLRALSTAERLGEGEARTERMAAARFGLGNALLEEGEPAGAVDQLEAALTAWVSTGNRLEEALTRTALGAALGRLGERSAAHEHLTAALAINRAQGERLRTAWSLYRLAELLAQERPDEARRAIEEAIDLSRHVRSGLFSPPLQAGFSEGSRRFYELYVNLLVDQGDTPAAFAASERGRAQALLDLITDARVDLTARADPALRLSAQELDLRIARLQRGLSDVVAPGGDERRAAAVRSELERAEEEWWRVQAAIRERLPGHRQVHQTETLTVEDARALLPPGLALLEYWIGEDRSYVFVLTRDALSLLRLPAAREIRSDVAAFRSALLRMGPAAEFAASANRLYEVLVAPALSGAAANGRIDDVIVVPDGSLHLLPFEALVTSPAGRSAGYRDLDYLLRTVTVSYVPSASVLANLERRKSVAGDDRPPDIRFVAFADPAYDSPVALDCPVPGVEATNSSAAVRSEQPERLRGSGREVEVIAARYPGRSRVYEGADATEARFKTAAEVATAERLHVAVHGVACESFPERSGLVFALDGGDGQDGILQTREIFNLDLSADLVVLSACETGLGRLVSGEGVVGLARAFFYSGARSLVVSLWPVSDRSTARLMASFYDSLDRGDDKAEALRQAQLGLVDAGGRDAAPFHWAPFVLLGSREQTTAGTAVTIEAP